MKRNVPCIVWSPNGNTFRPRHKLRVNPIPKVTEVLGIRKTTSLHPQSDGMVERINRTMEKHLSKVTAEHQEDWDRHLLLFLLVYRSAVHDRTGQTAAGSFQKGTSCTCDILYGSPSEEPKEVIDYVDDLKKKLLSVHETVRHKI
ncbi:uncharacterized protein LOC135136223 [Zophobas morio]|uniref:uncharacterized protein LOC135136223 n=1 Tax=Zophobas morio TaxID=2755281 RepID=UPI003082D6F9